MELCAVLYRNYQVFQIFAEHYLMHMRGDWKLRVVDNSPAQERHQELWVQDPRITYLEMDLPESFSDGESCGMARDHLAATTTSETIGILDTDFFWLDPDFLTKAKQYLLSGEGVCIGAAGFYHDFQMLHDPRFPNRQGHMAPVSNSFFARPELVRLHTQITTAAEGGQGLEQNWRLREYLIENHLPTRIIPGFYREGLSDAFAGMVFFGEDKERPVALHALKGSFPGRVMDYDRLQQVLTEERAKWQ
jgi:hypothetical protein